VQTSTKFSMTSQVLLAMACGIALGQIWPEAGLAIGPLAKIMIQMVKAIATPLVFLAVCDALINHNVEGRDFGRLLGMTSINGIIAIFIGISVATVFQPGEGLTALITEGEAKKFESGVKTDFWTLLSSQLPESIVQPFIDNAIMPTVVLALLVGFSLRKIKYGHDKVLSERIEQIQALIVTGRAVIDVILAWIIRLIPFAVFAASARVVAQHGLSPLSGLFRYAGLCLLAMFIHVIFVYHAWIVGVARMSVKAFWQAAARPMLYAFGVNSSLVSLPLTLAALDKLGVSRRASTLAACVGTNLNNDGIILYEGFTFLALAQAAGAGLSIEQQVLAAIYCIVAAMGVAGVPEAGVIALSLVLSSVGLSPDMITLLLSVDWILARARSAVNVVSDMSGSIVLDHFAKRRAAHAEAG
jgi:Na+/H+-dicarboxylate symporter